MSISTAQATNILTGGAAATAARSIRKVTNLSAEVPINSWYLELINEAANHYKFYLCMASDAGHLIIVWGRIGSAGQCKIEKFSSYKEAETVALKQVYAKASKGYAIKEDGFKFTATVGDLEEAVKRAGQPGAHSKIYNARHLARTNPKFKGEQATAARHYDNFIEAAETMMSRAANEPVETLFDDWQALQDAWAELADKHSIAATTLSLTAQMLQNKLAGL